MTAVMTEEQADAVFDLLESEDIGEKVEFGEDFEPGTVKTIYKNDAGTRLPGQKVRIYDTRTGYASDILPYMLKAVMKMQWPKDGGPMYSRKQLVQPPVGTSWCFLHPEFPDRERVIAAGVGSIHCSKPTPLLSIVHATRHAETRHGDTYKIYQRYIEAQREDERREFERMQMEMMRRQLAEPIAGSTSPQVFRCAYDGCPRFFDSEQGLRLHRTKEGH